MNLVVASRSCSVAELGPLEASTGRGCHSSGGSFTDTRSAFRPTARWGLGRHFRHDPLGNMAPRSKRGMGLQRRGQMLHYAVVFFIIALIAAVFGFGGIAAGAVGIAKVLFFVFLILAAVSFIANMARRT